MSATAVPRRLADGLAHAFKSDQTPPFEQMVSVSSASPIRIRRRDLLNQLLASLGPTARAGARPRGLGGLAGLPRRDRDAAAGAAGPAEAVQMLAQQAAKKDPSIMDQAAGFYAQHPTLVKAIGAGALALLMSKISSRGGEPWGSSGGSSSG